MCIFAPPPCLRFENASDIRSRFVLSVKQFHSLAGGESGVRGHTTVCVEAGLYRGCLRVRPFKYSYQRVSNYLLYGAKQGRRLRKVLQRDSGAGKPSHSCNPAQYDDIVHIIVGVIFPIPMRKVKGNSGSPPSAMGGKKRVPEGASGPHQRSSHGLQHTFWRRKARVGESQHRGECGGPQLRMVRSTASIPQLCSPDQFGKKSSLHSR